MTEKYECCQLEEGILLDVKGYEDKIHCQFEMALIIGDMVGHDEICCRSKGYSKVMQRPFRMCYVSHENLDNPYECCELVYSRHIFDKVKENIDIIHENRHGTIGHAKESLKLISQQPIVPTLHLLFQFGGYIGGLLVCCAVETLHGLLLGPLKKSLMCLFAYQAHITSNKKVKVEDDDGNITYVTREEKNLTKIFHIISDQISHQSDRDLPRAKFFGNVTKMAHFSKKLLD